MSQRVEEVLYEAPATKWPEQDSPRSLLGASSAGWEGMVSLGRLSAGSFRARIMTSLLPLHAFDMDVFNVAHEAMQRLRLIETPARASDIERRLAMLEQQVSALKRQIDLGARHLPSSAIDLSGILDAYEVADRTQLEHRIDVRPSMHATITGAAIAIRELFKDGRPKLVFEVNGRISIHIPTKLEAEQASTIYDQLLAQWWRGNVSVEDKMSLVLDFI